MPLKTSIQLSPLDILADELGAVAGRIEREIRQRTDAYVAKLEADKAKLETRVANLELLVQRGEHERDAKIAARLAEIKDGKDGAPGKDGEPGKDGTPGTDGKDADHNLIIKEVLGSLAPSIDGWEARIDQRLAEVKDGRDGVDGKDGRDGIDGKDADIGPLREEIKGAYERLLVNAERRVEEALATVKDGKDGRDGIDGKDGEPGPPGKDGKDGKRGKRGKMPVVKEWTARVHYEGEIVSHDGSTYQALKDTGGAPPSSDWVPLALRGKDANPWEHKGVFDAEKVYQQNDVVTFERSSFIAIKDNPGDLSSGQGWKLLAGAGSRGKEGQRGQKGDKGDKGEASEIIDAKLSDDMFLTFVRSDGEKIEVDLSYLPEVLNR